MLFDWLHVIISSSDFPDISFVSGIEPLKMFEPNLTLTLLVPLSIVCGIIITSFPIRYSPEIIHSP